MTSSILHPEPPAIPSILLTGGAYPEPKGPARDAATPLVKLYLLKTGAVREEAWEHLVKLCMSFLKARPGKAQLRLQRTDQVGDGGSEVVRFVTDWLSQRLAPYFAMSPRTIRRHARAGRFRYIGRQCRNAVVDEYRRRKRQVPPPIGLDEPLPYGDCGKPLTIADTIGVRGENGPALAWSPLGRRPSVEPEELTAIVKSGRKELEGFIGSRATSTLEAIIGTFPCPNRPVMVKAIAKRRGVSEQQARRDLNDLPRTMTAALTARLLAPRDLWSLLLRPDRPVVESEVADGQNAH
jgi:hypothetical protein